MIRCFALVYALNCCLFFMQGDCFGFSELQNVVSSMLCSHIDHARSKEM